MCEKKSSVENYNKRNVEILLLSHHVSAHLHYCNSRLSADYRFV